MSCTNQEMVINKAKLKLYRKVRESIVNNCDGISLVYVCMRHAVAYEIRIS
jgi:hypothetical protein